MTQIEEEKYAICKKAYNEIKRTEAEELDYNTECECDDDENKYLEEEEIMDIHGFDYLLGENENFIIESEYYDDRGDGNEMTQVMSVVVKATGEVIYIRFNGTYSSWDYSEWGNFEIVTPREVKVIQYFPI